MDTSKQTEAKAAAGTKFGEVLCRLRLANLVTWAEGKCEASAAREEALIAAQDEREAFAAARIAELSLRATAAELRLRELEAAPRWTVRVTRSGVTQTTTGFSSREEAQAWADAHFLPEDGCVVVAEVLP